MNKANFDRASSPKDILLYVVAYLLWFVNTLVCVAAVIQVLSLVNVLWVVLNGDRYVLWLVNQVVLLLGSFVAFGYVIFLESRYRESVAPRNRATSAGAPVPAYAPSMSRRLAQQLTAWGLETLLRRFVIATGIPLGVWLAAFATGLLALRLLP